MPPGQPNLKKNKKKSHRQNYDGFSSDLEWSDCGIFLEFGFRLLENVVGNVRVVEDFLNVFVVVDRVDKLQNLLVGSKLLCP